MSSHTASKHKEFTSYETLVEILYSHISPNNGIFLSFSGLAECFIYSTTDQEWSVPLPTGLYRLGQAPCEEQIVSHLYSRALSLLPSSRTLVILYFVVWDTIIKGFHYLLPSSRLVPLASESVTSIPLVCYVFFTLCFPPTEICSCKDWNCPQPSLRPQYSLKPLLCMAGGLGPSLLR